MLLLWFSGGIKAFTAITPCKILHCLFPCPSPQHLHMVHMESCGQIPHPVSSGRAAQRTQPGVPPRTAVSVVLFPVFSSPSFCARWRPTNGFKRLCMSELSFQTAGEANDPSPLPLPWLCCGGWHVFGEDFLSSGPTDISIQHCYEETHSEMQTWCPSLPRCDDV